MPAEATTTESGHPPLLLDADALNLAAGGAVDLAEIGRRRPMLLTPHPGEMGRLRRTAVGAGAMEESDATDRLESASEAAHHWSAAVLLKGAPSVVAAPDGPTHIDTQSSSDLAVAGMGDALSGVCVALLAQGLEPAVAGAVGLYLSGRAAVLAARGSGLTPSDVIERLPDVLSETAGAETDLALPFVLFDADPAR